MCFLTLYLVDLNKCKKKKNNNNGIRIDFYKLFVEFLRNVNKTKTKFKT